MDVSNGGSLTFEYSHHTSCPTILRAFRNSPCVCICVSNNFISSFIFGVGSVIFLAFFYVICLRVSCFSHQGCSLTVGL